MVINEILGGKRVEIESCCSRFGIYTRLGNKVRLQGEGDTLREALIDALERATCWDFLNEKIGDRAYKLYGVEYLNTRGAMLGEEPTQEDEERLHEMEEKAFESLDDLELFDAIRNGDLSCFIDWKERAIEEARKLYEREMNDTQKEFVDEKYNLDNLDKSESISWLNDEMKDWAKRESQDAWDEDAINYYLNNTSEVDYVLDDFGFEMKDWATPYEALIEAGKIGLSLEKWQGLKDYDLLEEFNNLIEEWEGF